jgi:hypothetical protein
MFSKSIRISYVIIFSLLIFSIGSTHVSAQTESIDQFSEDFERARDEAQQEFEEESERIDQLNEQMQEDYESTVLENQEEFEEYSENFMEDYNQKKEEFEQRQEDITKPFYWLTAGIGCILGLSILRGGLITFFFLFVLLFSIGGLVFDIIMIIDCLNREEFKDRSTWLAILIAGGLLGFGLPAAVVYYFVVKKKLDVQE